VQPQFNTLHSKAYINNPASILLTYISVNFWGGIYLDWLIKYASGCSVVDVVAASIHNTIAKAAFSKFGYSNRKMGHLNLIETFILKDYFTCF
jgi:hypothetical protein